MTTLPFPNPPAESFRGRSRGLRRCPKLGKPGISPVFLAKRPFRFQETPAAIRAAFAVQHLAGTGAQPVVDIMLWYV